MIREGRSIALGGVDYSMEYCGLVVTCIYQNERDQKILVESHQCEQ